MSAETPFRSLADRLAVELTNAWQNGFDSGRTEALLAEYEAAVDEADQATPFRCPRCGNVTTNLTFIRVGYCPRCHDWTRPDDCHRSGYSCKWNSQSPGAAS